MGFESKSEQNDQSDASSLSSGDLQYTAQAGANSSVPTYQEASGAPVEVNSPLGYSVGWITVIFLNLSKMIGTGVFSTRMSSVSSDSIPSIDSHSINCPQRRRVRWPGIVLLGHWILHGRQLTRRVSGVFVLFPQSVGLRGGLSRTGVSAAKVLSPDCFCDAIGFVLV
jgi:hypothetical protein